jgi:hypothetical protein
MPVAAAENLVIGSRVYCGLYGGKYGIVYAIHGQQTPYSVGTVSGVMATGGSAEFDIVFDDGTVSTKLPEAIVRSPLQWSIRAGVATAAEIQEALDFAAEEQQRRKDEAAAKLKAFNEEVERLRADPQYSYLKKQGREFGHKTVAANLRIEFKRAFPSVKFSITCPRHGTVEVRWAGVPDGKAVSAITSKYEDDNRETPWTRVFGGARYVFCYVRETSQLDLQSNSTSLQNA